MSHLKGVTSHYEREMTELRAARELAIEYLRGALESLPSIPPTPATGTTNCSVSAFSSMLAVFREIARVLKPGGVFLFKTPNKTHSMPTIARLTPHCLHQFVNRIRGRAEADTFPTRYQANTVTAI